MWVISFKNDQADFLEKIFPRQWKNYKQILNEYKVIFLQYKLFGDYGKLNKYFVGKILRKVLSVLLRKPIPGWYDTHAKHSSVIF